ncbi:MAG: hypothetical protein ACOC3A_03790 [Thermodesulfobacteriota bacterium]
MAKQSPGILMYRFPAAAAREKLHPGQIQFIDRLCQKLDIQTDAS